ncbi:unnamed protein product [Vitrella brassicaformis CCMP3155]|uniref:Uncharacterized protein n=1 Tax=Vitrella brassicaformis (strain CCMP3155) TaxID=1169540 RepID=A0A0G4EPG8_VITBC|nr:unnamed protein product [Vitrella brassicaformis CCMP3155]|eukprot:CEL99356.1 unnamed protein product [Vitrella brassicaformis CCMP3155]
MIGPLLIFFSQPGLIPSSQLCLTGHKQTPHILEDPTHWPPSQSSQRADRGRQNPRHRLRELTRAWREDRAAARRARAGRYALRQRASFLEDLDVLPDGQRRDVVNRLASGPASPRAYSEEPRPQPSAAGDQPPTPLAPVQAPSGSGGSRNNASAPAPSSAPRNRGSGGPGPHGNPPPPPPAGRGPAQPQAPPPSNQPPAPFPEDALRDLLTWDMHSIMTANIPTVTRWPLQDDFALRATKADLMVNHADPQLQEAACRLVLLLPTLLLFPTKRSDPSIWRARIRLFDEGDWRALRDEALAWARRRSNTTPATSASRARRLIKCAELRRAANALTSGKVLPNNDDTLAKLRALHPAASFPLDPSPTLPPNNAPRTVFEPDDEHLLGALKTAPKGSAQGGTGWRYEHLRAIHNWRCKVPLPNFVRLLVHSRVPPSLRPFLSAARLSAFEKTDDDGVATGGVRPIAMGETIRRWVTRAIVQQKSPKLEAALAPCQYAVGVASGSEKLIAAVRTFLSAGEPDERRVLLSLDAKNAKFRARRLIKCAELRRAANALTSGKVLPNNDDTLAKLHALHPAASFPLDPSPTLPPNNAPRTVFEPDDEHLLGARAQGLGAGRDRVAL